MNCYDIHNYCDAYLDHEMSNTQRHALQTHLESCPACRQYLQQAEKLRDALSKLKAPTMPPEFSSRAFDKVRQQNHGAKRLTNTGLALAASLALAGIVGVFMHQPDSTLPEPNAIQISLQQTRDVNLVFNAKKDLNEVTISIELSDNLALDGFAGKQTVSWNTTLQKGKNVLSLPIIATQSGNGMLTARLRLGNQDKIIRIPVNAQQSGSTQIQINSPHNLVQI